MSHNTNNPGNKNPTASHDQPTPWEQSVLHAASLKKLLLFDLELDDNKRFPANKSRKEKKRSMSETDTDTAASMTEERQRANSAPSNTASTNTSTSTSFASSFESITPDSSDHVTFGPVELLALNPATFREDTERQAALIKVRASEGLTMKRRLQAEEGLPESDGEFMMSGALGERDARCECEVCAVKMMAYGRLEAASPTL